MVPAMLAPIAIAVLTVGPLPSILTFYKVLDLVGRSLLWNRTPISFGLDTAIGSFAFYAFT